MITNQDRSGYFGASDCRYVMAKNHTTKSFIQWWEIKCGHAQPSFTGNRYTEMGNRLEHGILQGISDEVNMDRQIIVEKYLLRVNYDGDLRGVIYEVKTHKESNPFQVSTQYWQQAQVEMYAYQKMQEELDLPEFKKLYIVSYPVFDDEYGSEYVTVDNNRTKFTEIKYDKHWIKGEYLPRLKHLSRCLKKGKRP